MVNTFSLHESRSLSNTTSERTDWTLWPRFPSGCKVRIVAPKYVMLHED